MLTNEIVEILQKYQGQVAEEISNINLAIEKIKDELNSTSLVLMHEVLSYSKNGSKNSIKELELHNDSIQLRKYIDSIQLIPYKETEYNNKELGIYDIIVLNSISKCSIVGHEFKDECVFIPVLDSTCNITYISVLVSHCYTCNQYIMLKDTFNQIDGVILCKVIDETKMYDNQELDEDDIDKVQRQSRLYKYGYNVNTQAKLSRKQRQIILSTVIAANIMTKVQVIDHLSTLITRGEKINSWKFAVAKWKDDRNYVYNYNSKNLPSIITDKIILRYSSKKE